MGLRAALGGVATLGVHVDDALDERRRVAITNYGALIGVVSCTAFAIGYGVAGPQFRDLLFANVAVVVAHLGTLFVARRGRRKLAKFTLLLTVHALIVYATLRLGLGLGFQYYFFLLAVLPFLFFGEHEVHLRLGFAGLSTVSCLFVFFAVPVADVADLPRAAVETMNLVSVMAVMGTLMIFVHIFTNDTARAEGKLAVEHARSERLLLNILPKTISTRLKEDDKAIADGFAEVTVLFADLVGFTELSQKLDPAALVDMLNHVFSAFDDLAEELGLEKIKTIGDCYMVAAGLPDRRDDHVEAAADMALGIKEALERINRESGYGLRLRIGLHTGPVIAGVIGKRKFIYDLWGDTVNTASRMESSGVVQEIQVSQEVHDRLAGKYAMESRGVIKVKGKGELATFLLRGKVGQEPATTSLSA